MLRVLAVVVELLLRVRRPAPGRHRAATAAPPGAVPPPPAVAAAAAEPPSERHPVLRGEDTPLVRPYLVAHERSREEARQQRARRRTLWLAVHGVDLGPRVIHGVEVAA
jgi:hypothetical protein